MIHCPCTQVCSPVLLWCLLLTQSNAYQWGNNPQNCPFHWGDPGPQLTRFLGPTRVQNPNGITISSAIFVGLTVVTNRQTHAASVATGCIFALCAMRPVKYLPLKKVKVAHTRQPSVGFQSWSRFLAVSLQVSHKPGGRLPLLSARPAVIPATLKTAATNFAAWWTEARWVWTVCRKLLPDSVAAAIGTKLLLRLSPSH